MWRLIVASAAPVEVKSVAIVTDPHFEWTSKLGLSSSFSRGNTRSEIINLNGEAKAEKDKQRYLVSVSTTREEQEGTQVKEQDRLDLAYNYLFRERWFFAANLAMERDPVALLDQRLSLSPAIGDDFWNTDEKTLNFQLGFGYQSEEVAGKESSSSLVEWRLRSEYDVLSGNIVLFHNHHLYRNQAGRENTVFNSVSGARYDISPDMFLSLQLTYDHDSEPPLGTDAKDVGVLFGAGINF